MRATRPVVVCHPGWIRAELNVRKWAANAGLVTDDAGRQRLERAGHGRMAGYAVPTAGPAELDLVAQWLAFIAIVDDRYDNDPSQAGPDRICALMDQLVAAVSDSVSDSVSDLSDPAVRAMHDLWQRTAPATSLRWRQRFARHYRQFADATCVEATRPLLGVDAYVRLRRHTITALPMLDIVERHYPDAETILDGLRDAAADTIAWTNDLADTAPDSLVGIVARENMCDATEAASIVRQMIEKRMADFDAEAAKILASHPMHRGLANRIEVIRAFRDGAVAWQGESGRHRPSMPHILSAAPTLSIQAALDRLAMRLSVAVAADGSIRGGCGSRVLESALLLALLRATSTHPDRQRLLVGYLSERRHDASPIDTLLIDACLDPAMTAQRATHDAAKLVPALDSVAEWRGKLKLAMFQVVLYLLCGARLDESHPPQATVSGPVSSYSEMHLLAARTIHAAATGRHQMVSPAEFARLVNLLDSQRGRLFWESAATGHLLGLHAIHRRRPRHPIVEQGITRTLLAQNPDGGLPYLDGEDIWLAAVAGLAFHAHPRLRPLIPRMSRFVASWQSADGAWPFASAMVQTDVDTAARCMELLHAAGPESYGPHLRRATRYLADMATASGGWSTWIKGDKPDLDMTAGAVIALAPASRRYGRLLDRAIGFILNAQREDGTFEPSWTLSESSVILRAVEALQAIYLGTESAARRDQAIKLAVRRLAATQHPDGGWGQAPDEPSDVLSTAQAVPVMARFGEPAAVLAASGYLLSRQHEDGSFSSIPDQVGPRPLPFDFPVLANIHALTALSHLAPHPPRRSGADGGGPHRPRLLSEVAGAVVGAEGDGVRREPGVPVLP